MSDRAYIAIDLKSFYASVECVDRGLNPLDVNLVVADETRTEKTICLAVSPGLKSFGIPGRPRLFEVSEQVRKLNALRRAKAPGGVLGEKSHVTGELERDPTREISYLVARPRMSRYMQVSGEIYEIYLKYVSPEDIHVYSIDEVFMDVTHYLKMYGCSPRELCMRIIRDVLEQTGITATAGVGENLYLCKIAMDIVAKKMPPDADGVRIAELDERSYRELLWDHEPITDFWRVGKGYAARLAAAGMRTMGDVARRSLTDEEELYRMFGVNAELLIDHAWGWEPCTMAEIKAYRPAVNSISSGQVLSEPYDHAKGRVIVQEMADLMALDLVGKRLCTDQIVLQIGYDNSNRIKSGQATADYYGRPAPKPAHGSVRLERHTASARRITEAALSIYDRAVDPDYTIRRVNLTAGNVIREELAPAAEPPEQMDLFADPQAEEARRAEEQAELQKERDLSRTVVDLKKKYGKNAVVKGLNFREGATTMQRNVQIGGHKA